MASGVAGEMSQGALSAPSLFLGRSLYIFLGVCKETDYLLNLRGYQEVLSWILSYLMVTSLLSVNFNVAQIFIGGLFCVVAAGTHRAYAIYGMLVELVSFEGVHVSH